MTSMYMNNFSSRDAIITLVASTMGMDEETAKSYLEDYSDEELQEMLQKAACADDKGKQVRLRAGTGTSDACECD